MSSRDSRSKSRFRCSADSNSTVRRSRRSKSPPDGASEPARLAYHAQATGDAEAVLKFAPAAAAQASKLGAHREAAIHYGEALRFAGLFLSRSGPCCSAAALSTCS